MCYPSDLVELYKAKPSVEKSQTGCVEYDYYVAVDNAMYMNFGSSVSAVEAFVQDMVNQMNVYYQDDFSKRIYFNLKEVYVAQGMNPWNPNPAQGQTIYDLLTVFNNWDNSNNFSPSGVSSLWTGMNYSGSIIGLAYTGAMCGLYSQNVLEYFTQNTDQLARLLVHEVGHNLNAQHDAGSGYIMSPSIGGGWWSAQSVSQINGYVVSSGCGGVCDDAQDTCFGNVYIVDTIVSNYYQTDTITFYDVVWVYDTILFVERDTVRITYILNDTVTSIINDTIWNVINQYDTIWIYDTVYITDTVPNILTNITYATEMDNIDQSPRGVYDMLGREVFAIRTSGYYIVNGKLYYIGF